MNLFSWVVITFSLVFYLLYRFVAKPSQRPALMAAGSVLFILLQEAPLLVMRFFYIFLTFAILAAGWLFGNALAKPAPERKIALLKRGAALILAPLVLFKAVQAVLPPQLIETVLTSRGGHVDVGSLAPLGISYFTFRVIAYLIEIRKGVVAPVGFLRYLSYVAFWPTFLAGPIERPKPFLDQADRCADPTAEDLRIGLARVFSGLFKKFILAGFFYQLAAPYVLLQSVPMEKALGQWETWQLWVCVHAYYFYLYLDFAGYSDVAIGTARLFGFRIMENFRWPILATNVADFWRRWHISLTGWITDYVYFGLGGNRLGLRRAAGNTLIAMLLVGLWHGLNLHFAYWGLYHAVFLILFRQYRKRFKRRDAPKTWWKTAASWFVTFQIVNLGWVLFVFGYGKALSVYAKLFGLL